MLDKSLLEEFQFDAEGLAEEFSRDYFNSHDRSFPVNYLAPEERGILRCFTDSRLEQKLQ